MSASELPSQIRSVLRAHGKLATSIDDLAAIVEIRGADGH